MMRLRRTFTWYSGRWKKVVSGQNILGIILTINGKAIPIGLKYCSKRGKDLFLVWSLSKIE
ncbi:hypothetical protein [Cyanobacterium aponinum]|uniref:hypothetical protein n=1 Tax=Cyanobacterium aponinum TaxID=379064 RepID=UPI0018ACC01E|nr:hypothetical protein [Cyanobacterium aponinum]